MLEQVGTISIENQSLETRLERIQALVKLDTTGGVDIKSLQQDALKFGLVLTIRSASGNASTETLSLNVFVFQEGSLQLKYDEPENGSQIDYNKTIITNNMVSAGLWKIEYAAKVPSSLKFTFTANGTS